MGSTHDAATIGRGEVPLLPGAHALENYRAAWTRGGTGVGVGWMLWNSTVMALSIAVGKIAISIISAYAVVFFRFPGRRLAFWAIFITLMLPVEVRIFPTFKVVADLGLVNTYAGLIVPVIASATATLLFRQFFLTIPDEFVEAAKMDGAGPLASSGTWCCRCRAPTWRRSSSSCSSMAGTSISGRCWSPPRRSRDGGDRHGQDDRLRRCHTEWNIVMATCVLAMLPPVLVVMLMQRWFVKGLTDTEK